MIDRETISRIRDSVDIVEVIKSYVHDLKPAGKDFKALCPFHSEKTPSFYVSPSKNIFHCFGCKIGGDVFKFVMQIENISYPQAVKKLASMVGIEIQETDEEPSTDRKKILEILKNVSDFYHKLLLNSEEAISARNYLTERGINQSTVERFNIGYAPPYNKIFEEGKKKYSVELLFKTGLLGISEKDKRPYDFLRNRIVFPIYDIIGNVIAFGGRTLERNIQPPYINTPDTPVYSKSRSLYGLFQAKNAIAKAKKVIVLEGYIDVLINHQFGFENAVAPLGTSITTEQIKTLSRLVEEIIFIFDSDESGKNAAIRAGELCLEEGIHCRICSLPEGIDPDEYILRYGPEKYSSLINAGVNPVEFKTEILSSKIDITKPENKSKFVKEMINTLIKIKDSILKQEMVKYVSEKVKIEESIIFSEMRRATNKNIKIQKLDESLLDGLNVSIRSLEEELICLCIHHPDLIKYIRQDLFTDERCIYIFPFLTKMVDEGLPLVKIIDFLDDSLSEWFIQLTFEERKYESPEESLDILLRDLNIQRQEIRRRQLEREVIPMWEGKVPKDIRKIEEYQELTKLLKGS
ncbi:MAG: DNA primase [Endomicrobiia bacterium]